MSGAANHNDAYDLGASFPVTEARRQRPGTTLLVTGAGGSAGRAAREILRAGRDTSEGVVVITTSRPATERRADLTAPEEQDDWLALVDLAGESDGPRPDDLAAVGRGLNEAIDGLDTPRVRTGILSLTGMLEHLDRTEAFKFCHVVRDRIDDAGFLGVATLDTDQVESATVSMLQEAFDGTVEIREDEKGELLRVVGFPDTPVTWHAWS
jgi:hypothetical protein